MSQITRCPSCATTFKVVADQLRISEGWVRCGQCKEVFDASAHLLPVAPTALLPEVSLTDLRAPTAPVARQPDALGAWGGGKSPAAVAPTAGGVAKAENPRAVDGVPSPLMEAVAGVAPHLPPYGMPSEAPATPVLDIPRPAVPAFLTTGAHADASAEDVVAPFAWRAHSAQRLVPGHDAAAPLSTTAPLNRPEPAETSGAAPRDGAPPPTVSAPVPLYSTVLAESDAVVHDVTPGASDVVPGSFLPAPALVNPAGYELPFAELRDSDAILDASLDAYTKGAAGLSAELVPPQAAQVSLAPSFSLDTAIPGDAQGPEPAPMAEPASPAPALPSVDFVPKADDTEPSAMELVKDDSHADVLQARLGHSVDDDDETDAPQSDPEVSFVVAARRKAFWRKPAVRTVLGLVFVVSLLGLGLQIVVQERDRIAALDMRTRPWLVMLCEPLHCELAPVRQIADVVIDSSSFNKARGDSYQLALTMKSMATIPLAMPAVELTLTDAQDQPVLRRVLLPTDMAAPAELPAKGEWGTSVSVLVTTGGARVAGYRLLAFYP